MLSVEWDDAPLRDVVSSTRFLWPGWMQYLASDNEGSGAPTFHIVSCTPNSYKLDETIRVNHSFLVPIATYNARTWRAWIHECYLKVMAHEVGEMLLFNGVREYGPHHGNGEDPYRVWHVGDLEDTRVKAGETKDG